MNKITSTLTGLAIVATASIAPAFAQGALSNLNGFTFVPTLTSSGGTSNFTLTGTGGTFNPVGGGAPINNVNFSLAGTGVGGSTLVFNLTPGSLQLTGGVNFTEPGSLLFTVVPLGGGNLSVASVNSARDGTQFNLSSPVPEASTVVSFGALLALGGLAVLRRKSVKNAA